MTKPFVFTLMDYMETKCDALNLTPPSLEWLAPEGYSVAIVQNDSQAVEKTYINGSNQYRTKVEVFFQGKVSERLTILREIRSYIGVFDGMVGQTIGDGVTIRKVETTTPSLREQTEKLILRYGFSVTIVYKD